MSACLLFAPKICRNTPRLTQNYQHKSLFFVFMHVQPCMCVFVYWVRWKTNRLSGCPLLNHPEACNIATFHFFNSWTNNTCLARMSPARLLSYIYCRPSLYNRDVTACLGGFINPVTARYRYYSTQVIMHTHWHCNVSHSSLSLSLSLSLSYLIRMGSSRSHWVMTALRREGR